MVKFCTLFISALLGMSLSFSAIADKPKQIVTGSIGQWTTSYIKDDLVARGNFGLRYMVSKEADGVSLVIAANKDDYTNKKTLDIRIVNQYKNAFMIRVVLSTANGGNFNAELTDYNPIISGMSIITAISDLRSNTNQLFVEVDYEDMPPRHFTFLLDDLKKVSKFVHQKNGFIKRKRQRPITLEQYNSIKENSTRYLDVIETLGRPDDMQTSTSRVFNSAGSYTTAGNEAIRMIWRDAMSDGRGIVLRLSPRMNGSLMVAKKYLLTEKELIKHLSHIEVRAEYTQ